MGRQSSGGRRARGNRDRRCHHLRGRHIVVGAIGANIGPLIIMAVAAIGWSVFVTLVIGRRIFRQHWFEHSIPEFGESQGMLACGFVMLDMVDPSRQTTSSEATVIGRSSRVPSSAVAS